jgi:Afadin- and alpha -actinin-Binding
MASSSLSSASAYLNNLLLARGLLQDGRSIDFAHPSQDGNTDPTMSRVINLLHDLVLRRDREAEQRESLVSNIRSLRAEESQRLLDMQRVQDKNAELSRGLTTAGAQERALKSAAKKAEVQARDLKEQMLKMKSTLDQVRAKCVSDVRKRDVELEKLKSHLASMQRGKREASGMKVNVINPQAFLTKDNRNGQDTNTTDWSLEKETNDFLAAIVNETSTENVSLRNIVTETMEALRDLTGLHQDNAEMEEDPIGVPGQYRPSRQHRSETDAIVSCETLAAQMTAILEHCRTILKDPSFVPIEEVQIREEEIIKLRIGWEKMANRWKEAVTMMDNWRKRMLDGKQTFDVQELSSLEFGRSVAVMPNGEPVLGHDDELSGILFDHSRISAESEPPEDLEAEIVYPDMGSTDIGRGEESDLEIPPAPSPKRFAASPARRGIRLPRPVRTMQEIDTNIPRPAFVESAASHGTDSGIGSIDGTADEDENVPPKHQSKIPRQRTEKSLPMSVAEKLAVIEAEAKAAEETRKEDVTHKRKAKNNKTKKTSRRRSTLSPEELASLMGVR